MQCPDDIAELLTTKLHQHFAAKGLDFKVHVVTRVRCVENMLPKTMTLSGGYKTREGLESPHSFVYLPRGWMSTTLQQHVVQMDPFKRIEPSKLDVVVLVKQNMADDSLSQAPLLILPAVLRKQAMEFLIKLGSAPETMIATVIGSQQVVRKSVFDFAWEMWFESGPQFM
jgi:hypothetical protein